MKSDFEKNKKLLEQLVKEIKEASSSSQGIHNSSLASGAGPSMHHSMVAGSTQNTAEKRDQRFSSNERGTQQARNKSQGSYKLLSTPGALS